MTELKAGSMRRWEYSSKRLKPSWPSKRRRVGSRSNNISNRFRRKSMRFTRVSMRERERCNRIPRSLGERSTGIKRNSRDRVRNLTRK